jgi:hypothetical protein
MQTVCELGAKQKCMVYMEMGSMWRYVNLEVPSVFATGFARSDFTTCIPVTWGGWGPLVRFKQAVFRVVDFEQISVLTRLATAVQPARGILTGSYLAHSSFDARCAWHTCVSWNQTIFFRMSGAPKMTPFATLWIIGHTLAYGLNVPQTSTIFRLLSVIKSVLWFISNGHLVAEICSFQVLSLQFEVVECCKIRFTLGLHAGILT